MKCPRCGSAVTLEPHTHPDHANTTIYRCQGKGDKPCKDWGTIVPEGVKPPANVAADIAKFTKAPAAKKVAKKKKAKKAKK